MHRTVYVGLSGGVDSAVSAALLKRAGYDVTGVFIKIWRPTFFECTWERDRLDAMRVAVALDIPFREIDLSDEYERSVISELTASYAEGITPNPDVTCNEKIKFGAFYDWARAEGADLVATGHYARTCESDGSYDLLRGRDSDKDQSYFLYRIERSHLPRVLFPVGEYTKSEVRAMARSWQLPVAQKSDSQGLCFVGEVSMRDFLRRYIPVERGAVHDMHGDVIGEHEGAALYTVGQRHGFSIDNSKVSQRSHYVVRVDAAVNILVVSTDKRDCERKEADLYDAHWLRDVRLPLNASVQSRYREIPFKANLSTQAERTVAMFEAPHIVSPGQSLVLYDGDVCLGGAKIR